MSGKFARECLCDQTTAEKRLIGDSARTLNAHSKKVTRFTGIVARPNLTFRSDDDDFNVSDVIMSRISCSADDGRVAFKVLAFRSIQYQRGITSHIHFKQRHTNAAMNTHKDILLAGYTIL